MLKLKKDYVLNLIVECSNEEQCKALVEWYSNEVNPKAYPWEVIDREHFESFANEGYGFMISEEDWKYEGIKRFKDLGCLIVHFEDLEHRQETIEKYLKENTHQKTATWLYDNIANYRKRIEGRVCCENCQQWEDSLRGICKQKGCSDYIDWVLWNPKNESDKH